MELYNEKNTSPRPPSSLSIDEFKTAANSWNGLDDNDCRLTLKTVSDILTSSNSSLESKCYYFYSLEISQECDLSSNAKGSNKDELQHSIESINGLGFVLQHAISDEILKLESDFYLHDMILKLRVVHIGTRSSLPVVDLLQMQRFHKAILCLEDENASGIKEFLNMAFIFNDLQLAEGVRYMDDNQWTTSSNGAWYLVYPIDITKKDELKEECIHCYDSVYIAKCADEAQVLVHNLRLVSELNTKTIGIIPAEESCAALAQDQWDGLLILANNISLCFVSNDSKGNRKTLHHTLKIRPPKVKATNQDGEGNSNIEKVVVADQTAATSVSSSTNSGTTRRMILTTYADHLRQKRPHLTAAIETHLLNPNHRLIAANQISTLSSHTLLLAPVAEILMNNANWVRRNSVNVSRMERIHFIAEQCRPIGMKRWYYSSRLFPSVFHRIHSWLLAEEARTLMNRLIEKTDQHQPGTANPTSFNSSPIPPIRCNMGPMVVDDQSIEIEVPITPVVDSSLCRAPSLHRILEALTPKMAMEHMDSERLEILGDALLKFAISRELYRIYPDKREGQLTSERTKYINNRKLCEVLLSTGIARYIRALPLSLGEKSLIFTPPGMSLKENLSKCSVWCTDIMATPGEVMYDKEKLFLYPRSQHQDGMVMFKKVADMAESLIGAYYIDGGQAAGIAVMKALGIWPSLAASCAKRPMSMTDMGESDSNVRTSRSKASTPCNIELSDTTSMENESVKSSPARPEAAVSSSFSQRRTGRDISAAFHARFGHHPAFQNPISAPIALADDFAEVEYPAQSLNTAIVQPQPLSPSLPDLAELESTIGYKFQDCSLLHLALTHSSISTVMNYERLEFLGDSVLDFVEMSYWFRRKLSYDPMRLHDLKEKNVCNHNLASKAYQLGVHKYIRHFSNPLQVALDSYCAEQAELLSQQSTSTSTVQRDSTTTLCVPKLGKEGTCGVMSDTLEAIIGAVFLDCGEDLALIEQFALQNCLLVE